MEKPTVSFLDALLRVLEVRDRIRVCWKKSVGLNVDCEEIRWEKGVGLKSEGELAQKSEKENKKWWWCQFIYHSIDTLEWWSSLAGRQV